MKFWKYHGAGNDFVMIDQREHQWLHRTDTTSIENLCSRHFGIGADGLILLQNASGYDFEMIYFNADGRESTMCGNGGRCIAAFAQHLGLSKDKCRFWAIDGEHEASISRQPGSHKNEVWVALKMIDVQHVRRADDDFVLNTGSPHLVRFLDKIENLHVATEGRAIRNAEPWKAEGINVNFVALNSPGNAQIRTYERGVEDETLACGTGVTAAAIASFIKTGEQYGRFEINLEAQGGRLAVRFQANPDGSFSDIWLCGPATQVFEGEIELSGS